MKLSQKTKRAVQAYGAGHCLEAFRIHSEQGEGAATIACYRLGSIRTTNQADAAINAGRELAAAAKAAKAAKVAAVGNAIMPNNKAELVALFTAQAAEVRADRPAYVGKFFLALVPADGPTLHLESLKGIIEWVPYGKAQCYSTAERAGQRLQDFAEGAKVPEGYTLAVVAAEAHLDACIADIESLLATWQDRAAA